MSKNGVWQLQKLFLYFSKKEGSSKGIRELIGDKIFLTFKELNPQITFLIKYKNGHPKIVGEYIHGKQKVLCVKNEKKKGNL
jgi:hypothetical protein